MADLSRDEWEVEKGGSNHRLRRDPRKAGSHVAI